MDIDIQKELKRGGGPHATNPLKKQGENHILKDVTPTHLSH